MFSKINSLFGSKPAPNPEAVELRKVIAWFGGRDTGLSSITMALHLSNVNLEDRGSTPSDAGDLGRCIRFLEYMDWEDRYYEMVSCTPEWAKMVSYWPHIVQAYKDEIAGEAIPGTCYALMKHCETGALPATFRHEDHPHTFTYAVNIPGLYATYREDYRLGMCDPRFPLEPRDIGTHQKRVYLSIATMQVWLDHATAMANDKTNLAKLRDSARRAADNLRLELARRQYRRYE